MASQQAYIGSIIAGMKKAVKRKAYDSDSDSSIEHLTNRGNKLRRKARYVHEGQLAAPTGPQVYKRQIEHAGYHRDIISFNPPLVDESGHEIDSDDDDEREAASPAQFDPYAEVRIENLLAPLTAASDLPNHPTLSKPFTSKALTELTKHAGEMVQKEKASLWKIKHLLARLSGDNTWIPCESMETDHDFSLFLDERDLPRSRLLSKVILRDGDLVSPGTLTSGESPIGQLVNGASLKEELFAPKRMSNAVSNDEFLPVLSANAPTKTVDVEDVEVELRQTTRFNSSQAPNPIAEPRMVVEATLELNMTSTVPNQPEQEREVRDIEDVEDVEDAEEPAPSRMRTRAQAQAASENTASSRARSISPDSDEDMFISPYFLAPKSSHPDRDLGLPQHEADDIRRLLQLYIQKQEEVCRGVQKVYDGLMKADRCRKQVMKWAKAEAHVGLNRDMSDGEDWYDKEEWGLEEDLKKGQDEEEEEAATTAKKTRTRRQ